MSGERDTPTAPETPLAFRVVAFSLYFSYLRVHLAFDASAAWVAPGDSGVPVVTDLQRDEVSFPHTSTLRWHEGELDLLIEAMVERPLPLEPFRLLLHQGGVGMLLQLGDLCALGGVNNTSLAPRFKEMIGRFVPSRPGGRALMLDIGGRARSQIERRLEYPNCDVTVFDIHADPSVDVVGDAHDMARHLRAECFDFVLCVSVFEHLLMPWKVAVEMNKVMRVGGLALIHTHQTVGLHDMPWDFYRFSEASWPGLFNRFSGFEIVDTMMSGFMQIVPRIWTPAHEASERSGGFEESSVIIRKTGRTSLDWRVQMENVISTAYPLVF